MLNVLIIKIDLPYFYLSNSSWIDRLLEPFRLLSRTKEAALKGYKAVLLFEARLTGSFPIAFFDSALSIIRRV
jgi:hypothetical protein